MRPVYIISFILLACCTPAHTPLVNNVSEEGSENVAPKIVFINYKISKKADDTVNVTFINKIIADGKLKESHHIGHPHKAGDLLCTQLNENLLAIDSLKISNPLIKDVEYISTFGQLDKKRIELDSAEFSIRMQLHPDTKFLILKMNRRILSEVTL